MTDDQDSHWERAQDRLMRENEDLRREISESRNADWNGPERRRHPKGGEWTLWKEVVGTFIGISPFLISLIVFGATMYSTNEKQDVRIFTLEEWKKEVKQEIHDLRQEEKQYFQQLSAQMEVAQRQITTNTETLRQINSKVR